MNTHRVRIIALLAAILAALLSFYYLQQVEASKPETTTVIKAATDISEGTQITEDMLTYANVYAADVDANSVTDPETLIGMYANTNIYAGEQMSSKKVSDQEASSSARSFSYKIPKGMRTVTIPIDSTSSVAGMLQVGDHVDILASYDKTNANGESENVTRFIADDIEIAALDQVVVRDDATDAESQGQTFTTVTMFVTPDLAKALTWENNNGTLIFTLRSPDETENPDHTEFNAESMKNF